MWKEARNQGRALAVRKCCKNQRKELGRVSKGRDVKNTRKSHDELTECPW